MYKLIVALALCVAVATASPQAFGKGVPKVFQSRGIVTPVELCTLENFPPPSGQPVQLRVTDCEGAPPCDIKANTDVTIEGDFIPSSSGLSCQFTAVALLDGTTIPISEGNIGDLTGGVMYTVTQTISVSSALVGRSPTIRIFVNCGNDLVICVQALTNIVP